MKTVQNDSTVDVEYEGRLDDGTLFDTSKEEVAKKEGVYSEEREYTTLHITLGQGMLIKGFENALVGMEEGEEKTVKIPASEAYGERREELVHELARDKEKDQGAEVGMMVVVNMEGRQIPARISALTEENISLDFNHPLAGKELTFKLEVKKIE